MKSLSELLPLLSIPSKIVITHHYNPDADALGSTLGLAHFLRKKGHSCQVISPNTIPEFLKWMSGYEEVIIFEEKKEASALAVHASSLLFCLDFNNLSRTKTMEPLLQSFKGMKVLIDHHLEPDTIFDYGLSMPSKSSTCEMVFDFIVSMEGMELIDLRIAQCLYAGAMTDTGSFKFPCTTPSVHAMVSVLMKTGLNTSAIHTAIFDTYEENRLRFLGYVLADKMIIYPQQHTSLIPISMDEMNRFRLSTGDTEGIVNYPLSIKDIIFSTFISERDNEIRMSFRSKGSFNVNEFARKYFNGGGHANAAGGRSVLPLKETIELFNQILIDNEKHLKQCYSESL